MEVGKFNQRLTLQSKTVVRDDLGEGIETWSDERTVWAEIQMITGRFVFAAAQIREPTTIKARIRRGPMVTNLWRGIWRVIPGDITQDRILNIIAVMPLDTRDGWDLLCGEGMNQG